MKQVLKVLYHLLYHQLSWSYDLVAAVVSAGQWNKWARVALPYLTGPNVLELGFGPGHLQQALLSQGCQALGLDESASMVQQAQRRLRRAGLQPRLVRGLAQHLPFSSDCFDQLAATFPSEYIADPRTMAEAYRVLRPGGQWVIVRSAVNTRPGPWATKLLFALEGKFADGSGGVSSQNEVPPTLEQAFLVSLRQAGFRVAFERVRLEDGLVLLFAAEKPWAPQPSEFQHSYLTS